MHDPLSVAFEIKYPWRKCKVRRNEFERNYRDSFITIWHKDPQRDGSDDSCDWFYIKFNMLERHAIKELVEASWFYQPDLHDYKIKFELEEMAKHVWRIARVVYKPRPWYKHPKWHFWHWSLQIHPWQDLVRFLFSRCCVCHRRFNWGEVVFCEQWNSVGPKIFRGERDVHHGSCPSQFNKMKSCPTSGG